MEASSGSLEKREITGQVAEAKCVMQTRQKSGSNWYVEAKYRGSCKPGHSDCETVEKGKSLETLSRK